MGGTGEEFGLNSLSVLWLPILFLNAACGEKHTEDSNSETGLVDTDIELIASVEVEAIEGSPLTPALQVELIAEADVTVEYWRDGGVHFQRQIEASGLSIELPLIGLPSESLGSVVVRACSVDGCDESSELSFTTGVLPFNVDLEIGEYSSPSDGSMVVVSYTDNPDQDTARIVGVDRSGEVVWIQTEEEHERSNGTIVELTDEGVFLSHKGGALMFDLFGGLLWDIDSDFNAHHDVELLPSGGLIFIVSSNRTMETEEWGKIRLRGDIVVEVDVSGEEVWRWDSFDHLSLDNVPEPEDGVSDFTHFNSIDYMPDRDAILIGSRGQSQVYLVDCVSSEILWTFGGNGDFELLSGSWFDSQHDVTMLHDGSILLYDNGNNKEPEVESRIVRYEIDEESKSASEMFAFEFGEQMLSMGGALYFNNGAYQITMGGKRDESLPAVVEEVTSAGEVVWRVEFPNSRGELMRIYRSERYQFADVVESPLD